jgi:hypothetical protein
MMYLPFVFVVMFNPLISHAQNCGIGFQSSYFVLAVYALLEDPVRYTIGAATGALPFRKPR